MAVPPVLQDRDTLAQRFIRTTMAYCDQLTWYGRNSLTRALAFAAAGVAEIGQQLYVALLRRTTLLGAQGEFLSQVMQEHGVERLKTSNAKLLLVVKPETTTVTAVTTGATDLIEVEDSGGFDVGMDMVIRSADGSDSEATGAIIAITSGTGPNSGDELEVATLTNSYSPGSENVEVLARITLAADTLVNTEDGVQFGLTESVTTGAANPVLSGEGSAVGLLDRVWCEAVSAGSSGNVQAYSVTDLAIGVDGIAAVYNPEPATGGEDVEADYAGRRRAAQWGAAASQETELWLGAIANAADERVLRAIRDSDTSVARTMKAKVLQRNGSSFTAAELTAIEEYLEARTRAGLEVSLSNVSLTSVEIEAEITLAPGFTLQEVYRSMASRLATYLDWRRWTFGNDVEEADLIVLVRQTTGVQSLTTETFTPLADVGVADDSLPVLARLSLTDTATGDVINATLTTSFATS
jgi:uncharacterized phage protein gp47/JayE